MGRPTYVTPLIHLQTLLTRFGYQSFSAEINSDLRPFRNPGGTTICRAAGNGILHLEIPTPVDGPPPGADA